LFGTGEGEFCEKLLTAENAKKVRRERGRKATRDAEKMRSTAAEKKLLTAKGAKKIRKGGKESPRRKVGPGIPHSSNG
jgi:hypothetical protein